MFDTFDVPPEVRDKLVERVKHRLTPQAEKIEAGMHFVGYGS